MSAQIEIVKKRARVTCGGPCAPKACGEIKGELAREKARKEVEALRASEFLVVLDRDAGLGTSTELGLFRGAHPFREIVWVRHVLDPKLAWFGPILATTTISVERWTRFEIRNSMEALTQEEWFNDLISKYAVGKPRRGITPPFETVPLVIFPRETWIGRPVLCAGLVTESEQHWIPANYPPGLRDEEDELDHDPAYDVGIVVEVYDEGGDARIRYLTSNGTVFDRDAVFVAVPTAALDVR